MKILSYIFGMFKTFFVKFLSLIGKIPIIGALVNISGRAIKEAFTELLLTLIFSTLPIWFSGGIVAANKYFLLSQGGAEAPTETSGFFGLYWLAIIDSVSNGELLMYSAATLGPTLYLAFLTLIRKARKPFPWVRPQILCAVLLNFIASGLFLIARENHYTDLSIFISCTALIYAISLVLLFPAMAFNHDGEADPSEIQRNDQKEFQAGYKRRMSRGQS
jgi:hypothetical protein